MDRVKGESLIRELLSNPEQFAKKGKGYNLLQEYFHGLSLDTLRPLLKSRDRVVQREVLSIVSELGTQGSSLIFDVIPFLNDNDRSIQYEALESVMLFSESENSDEFRHVVESMEVDDLIIRVRAMYLVSNANDAQLRSALKWTGDKGNLKSHREGLSLLLEFPSSEIERVRKMMQSSDSITRKYGAIAAKRIFKSSPELIHEAVNHTDPDIKRFVEDVIEIESE